MTHFKQIRHWMRRNNSQMVTSKCLHACVHLYAIIRNGWSLYIPFGSFWFIKTYPKRNKLHQVINCIIMGWTLNSCIMYALDSHGWMVGPTMHTHSSPLCPNTHSHTHWTSSNKMSHGAVCGCLMWSQRDCTGNLV